MGVALGGGGSCHGRILLWENSLNSRGEPLKRKNSPCSSLPLQTSASPLTQPNFPTTLETIQVRVRHGPTLPPSPGVTRVLNFSGNDPASVYIARGCTLPLCVCHFIFIPFSDITHPGDLVLLKHPCLAGEGAVDLALIQEFCG